MIELRLVLLVAEEVDGRPNAIGSFQFLFGILEATPWPVGVNVLAPFLMNLAGFFSRQPTAGCQAAGENGPAKICDRFVAEIL